MLACLAATFSAAPSDVVFAFGASISSIRQFWQMACTVSTSSAISTSQPGATAEPTLAPWLRFLKHALTIFFVHAASPGCPWSCCRRSQIVEDRRRRRRRRRSPPSPPCGCRSPSAASCWAGGRRCGTGSARRRADRPWPGPPSSAARSCRSRSRSGRSSASGRAYRHAGSPSSWRWRRTPPRTLRTTPPRRQQLDQTASCAHPSLLIAGSAKPAGCPCPQAYSRWMPFPPAKG